MGVKEEPMRYSQTDEKVMVWRISNYHPTPEPLTRAVMPTTNSQWANEHEVIFAKKMLEDQPILIANLEEKLAKTKDQKERENIIAEIEFAKTPIIIPELIPCSNGTEESSNALIQQYGFDNWYDWRIANWGTKWDCDSTDMGFQTDNETYFWVEFDSAWSPPIAWLAKVAKMFQTLHFKLTYMEIGMWYAGVAYTNGNDGEIEVLDGEPENQDGDGNVYTYNPKKNAYVSQTGETIDAEEWMDSDYAHPVNPFDDFDAPWE
jgi:hypothetical protein